MRSLIFFLLVCTTIAGASNAATIQAWVIASAGGEQSGESLLDFVVFSQFVAGKTSTPKTTINAGYLTGVGPLLPTSVPGSVTPPLVSRLYLAAPNPLQSSTRLQSRIVFDTASDSEDSMRILLLR
jgi:hypothetical protein